MNPIALHAGFGIKFNSNMQNVTISADNIQLQRVLKNLINNAIDHSHTKKDIEITIGEDGDFRTISVTDYGQGIPKDEIKMIFNKYYSAAKKLRKVGTGLGLYLSQQIVVAHGGEILVNSEENVRTEFCIKLPA